MKKNNAYIIGAGVTGLSAAYNLSKSNKYYVTVFDKADKIGGMALTFKKDGYFLDLGPHKFFSNLKNREKEVLDIIGDDNLLKIKKESQIRLFNRFIDFPVGLVDILKINPITGLSMGIDYGLSIIKKILIKKTEKTYKDYLSNRFGSVAYNLTFAPYAQKIWGNPETLDKDLAATRVAAPNLLEMIKQMIFKVKSKTTISADFFHYPKYGSGILLDRLATKINKTGGHIKTSSPLESIEVNKNSVISFTINNNKILLGKNDIFISTIPIETLVSLSNIKNNSLTENTKKLQYRNILLVYLVINKNNISNQNWYFFPEKKYIFNRVFEQKNFSSFMIPKNKTVLCCEITCNDIDKIWNESSDQSTINTVTEQLIECNLINKADIRDTFTKRLNHGYPIYFVGYKKILDNIFSKLDSITNLFTIGRQGGYNYVGMIDCFDIGIKTTDHLLGSKQFSSKDKLRESFFQYIVID